MPTRNVNLTEHYESFLARLIESGRYKNASEAVRAGLRLLEREEQEEAAKLEALRQAVAVGTEAYRRGEYKVIEDDEALGRFFEGIEAEFDRS